MVIAAMRLFGILSLIFLLTRGQYTHEWSWSQCGGSQADDNQLLPGINGHVVSLDVECDPSSDSTVLSWSNGGLELAGWISLIIGYTCSASEVNESMIECIPDLCRGGFPALSSSSYTLTSTAGLGTECAFLGCYEGGFGYENTWFTFSSQTCTWPSDAITATPTPSMSHTTVQPTDTAEPGGSAAYSSAIPDAIITATPTPHTTVQPTDTAEPGGSATYSSAIPDKTRPTTSPTSTYVQPESLSNQTDSPSSFPVLAWLVPVVLVTCVTAVIGVTIATCCYFLTRKTPSPPGKKVFDEFYRPSILEERPNLFYEPVSIHTHSMASIESDKTDYENIPYESDESEGEEIKESSKEEHQSSTSEKSDTKDETLHTRCSADIDKGYLNVQDATNTSFAEGKIIERSECSNCNAVNESSGQKGHNIPEVVTDSETRLTGNKYSSELGTPIYVQDTDFIGQEQIVHESASQEVKVNIWDDVRSDPGDCFNDIAEDGRDNKID